MTDTLNNTAPTGDTHIGDASTAAAPPKKKRTFFKKASWQTAPKAENDEDTDIFSHRKEIARELEEENRLKRERRRKEEAERKRKEEEKKRRQSEERRERKRRKISLETEDELPRSGSTSRSQRKGLKDRSRTPNSPIPVHNDPSSLTARYDSLTKSSSSQTRSKPVIIDLGDDSDEDDAADEIYNPPKPRRFTETENSIPVHSRKPAPTPAPSDPPDDLDADLDDPALAAVLARARERARAAAANKPTPTTSTSDPFLQKKDDGPIVELFVSSRIPDTVPLRIKARANHTLGKIRLAWCGKQGFSEDVIKGVFLTWKNIKVVDSTKIVRLGIQVDEHGGVTMENAPGLYDENNPPKVHIEAWTEDIFEAHKRSEAKAAAAARKADVVVEEELLPEPEPEPEATKIRLILKAKNKQDFKIAVKPTTTIEQLASAYKQRTDTPEDQPITLMFDGDRLRPMDTIADTDIEDMDAVEVHFK